jgi:hypothetical protein
MSPCPGPLIWYDTEDSSAVLECAACGYLIVSGSLFDREHNGTPLLREGLATP